MSKVKKRKAKKTTPARPVTPAPAPVDELETCPECNGTGIKEFAAGLVSRKCRTCKGTGKVAMVVA